MRIQIGALAVVLASVASVTPLGAQTILPFEYCGKLKPGGVLKGAVKLREQCKPDREVSLGLLDGNGGISVQSNSTEPITATAAHSLGLRSAVRSTTVENLNGGPPYFSSLFKAEFPVGKTGWAFAVTNDGNSSISASVDESGNATFRTVTITGGADLTEPFALRKGETAIPGSVLVVDATTPRQLRLSTTPYESRVVGVISGAGDIKPGVFVGSKAKETPRTVQLAMLGQAYVLASTENGEIRPGDLLTTSTHPGRAMKATDPQRSFGAVIGKALSGLKDDSGLVLTIVNLQ